MEEELKLFIYSNNYPIICAMKMSKVCLCLQRFVSVTNMVIVSQCRLIVPVDCSCLTKPKPFWISMKHIIRHTNLCTVSSGDIFSPIACFILVTIMCGARNCRNHVRCEKWYNRMAILFPHERRNPIALSILLSSTYSSLGDDQQPTVIQLHIKKHHGNKITHGHDVDTEMVKLW